MVQPFCSYVVFYCEAKLVFDPSTANSAATGTNSGAADASAGAAGGGDAGAAATADGTNSDATADATAVGTGASVDATASALDGGSAESVRGRYKRRRNGEHLLYRWRSQCQRRFDRQQQRLRLGDYRYGRDR